MEKFKKFLLWLKTPSALFATIYSIISTAIIALTVVLLALGRTNNIFGYIMYGLSFVALTYLVYVVVYFAPKMKNGMVSILKKHKFTNELLESYGYRSVVFASFSFVINVLFALFQAVIAIVAGSIWYGALAGYYMIISLIRGSLVSVNRKRNVANGAFTVTKELKSYRNCGISIVVLNFALVAAIVQMVIASQGFKYAGLMIYVMATYAFYKLGLSIYNLFKAKRHNDYIIQAIKNIGFADALVSILALQTALLDAFMVSGSTRLANSLVGGAVSVAIVGMGIYMIVNAHKKIKKLKNGDVNEG